MDSLLARFAEHGFWIARYIERVEKLARILDINETFVYEQESEKNWLPIVQLHTDEEKFFENHKAATASAVIYFYILDRDNTNSIVSLVHKARENTREIRHLVGTEVWTQINVFYNRISRLTQRQIGLSKLSSICSSIILDCQLHKGIVDGTVYHDQLWHFYKIGQSIERADMSTRLLDMKYHRLLPSTADVGSPIDIAEWNVLLRSLVGYYDFRRYHPREMEVQNVAEFLILDRDFPGSVAACVDQIQWHIDKLRTFEVLQYTEMPVKTVSALLGICRTYEIETIIDEGMHEFLDKIQEHLIEFTTELGQTFFGHRE